MIKTLTGVVAIVALVVGCATFQPGETVVKWESGSPMRMAEAPSDGQYALFSGTDLRNAQVSYELKKGDKLGFTQRDGSRARTRRRSRPAG
jgi:hypothetical protein